MPRQDEVPDFTFDGSNMFETLLSADPSFREKWDRAREEREEPLYLALSEFALHMIRNLEAGHTDRFRDIFDIVERWITEGNAHVKEAAVVGLLEDLQNGGLHHTTTPDDFKRWLRPQSVIWWTKLGAFWGTGTPMV